LRVLVQGQTYLLWVFLYRYAPLSTQRRAFVTNAFINREPTPQHPTGTAPAESMRSRAPPSGFLASAALPPGGISLTVAPATVSSTTDSAQGPSRGPPSGILHGSGGSTLAGGSPAVSEASARPPAGISFVGGSPAVSEASAARSLSLLLPPHVIRWRLTDLFQFLEMVRMQISTKYIGRSGPNLEPGTMRVHVTNGPRNGLNIGRRVGPCPGSRRRWVLGSVHAFS